MRLLRRSVFRGVAALSLVLSNTSVVTGQTGSWTAHTSMREVTALTRSSDAIWVGTTGGLFSYAPTSGEIRRYTIAEGLHGISVTAIAFDPGRENREAGVWIGYRDGVLDRISLTDGAIRTFRDIERASRFPSREINRLEVKGDSLLASTSFGLVVFDLNLREVRDSYTQLGSLNPGASVRDILVAPASDGTDYLWLATEEGVARAPASSPNLKDPSSWTVERSGLPSLSTHSLAYFLGAVYVGTDQGLAARTEEGQYVNTGASEGRVSDLEPAAAGLLAVDNHSLIVIGAEGGLQPYPDERVPQPASVLVDGEGRLWIGDRREGLAHTSPLAAGQEPMVERVFYPEGPYHNLFASLQSGRDGSLWAGGAFAPQSGNGFYRLSAEGEWTSFIGRNYPALQGRDSYTRIHLTADEGFWAGSQGQGLAVVMPDGEIEIIDHTNSSILPADGTSSIVLTGGIGSDSRGRIWVTSRYASRPLNVRLPDGQWRSLAFQSCDGVNATTGTYDHLYVDSYGQKWIDIKDRADLNRGIGLMILDTGNTPEDASDDACRFLGQQGAQGQGMPGIHVTSMVEDRAGLMWVGTDRGLAYFLNNGILAFDRTATPIWPQHEDRSQGVFVFQGLSINALAVDPANQVWVATDEGAWLIRQSGGGFVVEEHFTTSNSPLLSNSVLAVAVEPRTGRVFFATDRGLVSYSGSAIAASPESRDLLVYPNPARVGANEDASILIEGLVEETEIMILALHGEVVRRFTARGGRARWDGRDESGRPAPSGMYLVVALGQDGEETAYGKLALIR